MARPIVMHAPDWLKSIKGEYDHISKCWTLMSKGRSRCPSILYCVNAYINSIILILQCLPLYSVLQLDSVYWITNIKGRAPELAPLSLYWLLWSFLRIDLRGSYTGLWLVHKKLSYTHCWRRSNSGNSSTEPQKGATHHKESASRWTLPASGR